MAIITLSRIVAFWAAQQPDRVAIDHEGEQVTWAELDARTNRLARAYEALGVKQDDFVTIALPNGIEFIEACVATWKAGATPQPISAKLPKFERDQIVELGRPSLVVGVAPGEYEDAACVPPGFVPDPALPDTELDERMAASIKAMTSGGSTGRPKLIVSKVPAAWDPAPRGTKPFPGAVCAVAAGATVAGSLGQPEPPTGAPEGSGDAEPAPGPSGPGALALWPGPALACGAARQPRPSNPPNSDMSHFPSCKTSDALDSIMAAMAGKSVKLGQGKYPCSLSWLRPNVAEIHQVPCRTGRSCRLRGVRLHGAIFGKSAALTRARGGPGSGRLRGRGRGRRNAPGIARPR